MTRPVSFLAFFWPANAVVLALMLRFPFFNQFSGWFGIFAGFMLADLITGNYFQLTVILTIANIISSSVSLFFINFFQINYKNYNKGLTFLSLFAICSLGGCLASAAFAVSTLPYVPNTFMSTDRLLTDFSMWLTSEMLNYILILPIILAFPSFSDLKKVIQDRRTKHYPIQKLFPVIAVIICVVLTYMFSGPGALLYPLAALIWAALSYRLFTVTVINFLVVLATYHSLNDFYLAVSADAYLTTAMSVRIGLCTLSLTPLILCIISQNRHELYQKVLYFANYDSLTQTMNRRYFFQMTDEMLLQYPKKAFSLLMLDIDHFKKINDQYGHYAGDQVLQQFAENIRHHLREDDFFARIGGEEFVILLKNIYGNEAQRISERIRYIIEQSPIELYGQAPLNITVSIGLTQHTQPQAPNIQQLINQADFALYQAKQHGRNQVISS
jgi:diguanylate cyclase (GGDEF)-like protein